MFKRKRKTLFDIFNEEDLFESRPAEGGSGYSISVTYDERGKPVVNVQTYGKVDSAELRKDIEQRYPGAKIEGLEPLIRVVGEKETKRKSEKRKPEEKKLEKKEEKKSLIRIVE